MFLKTLTSLQAWCRVTLNFIRNPTSTKTIFRSVFSFHFTHFQCFRTLPSDTQKRCRFAWNCSAGQVCWRTPRRAAVPNTPLVRRRFLRSLLLSLLLKAQRHAHTHWHTLSSDQKHTFYLCLGSPTTSVCLLLTGCLHDAMQCLWFIGWFLCFIILFKWKSYRLEK